MVNFLDLWQNIPSKIDPVFHIAGLPIWYYGLAYIVAYLITYVLLIYRIRGETRFCKYEVCMRELMVVVILGIFFGGRVGYIFMYNPSYYANNPIEIILPFSITDKMIFIGFRGMSYHGGLIGGIIAVFLYAKLYKMDFFEISELFIPILPLAYTVGRIGNFINGELYGRPTSLVIGMYFPLSNNDCLRHPSQLYEALFEGLALFLFFWFLKRKACLRGYLLGFYFVIYGMIRFFIEYLREPDIHLGYIYVLFSMGQILCIFMIIVGLSVILLRFCKNKYFF